jgi:hypothetical protein
VWIGGLDWRSLKGGFTSNNSQPKLSMLDVSID